VTSKIMNTPENAERDCAEINLLVEQVERGKIYAMTEDFMTKWERGELAFKVGDDEVNPKVHGRTGIGFNVSFA